MQYLLLLVLPVVTTLCTHVSQFTVQSGTSHDPQYLHPVIRDFQYLIESDPEIWLGFHQMFDEIPNTQEYFLDPSGLRPQVYTCPTISKVLIK